MRNKIRKITYSILLVLLIALMGLTLAACDEELGEVRFTYNGQQVERIDKEISDKAGSNKEFFLELFDGIKKQIMDNPEMLTKHFWK